MALSATVSGNTIRKELVVRAYEISDFIYTGHAYSKVGGQEDRDVRYIADYIATYCPRPDGSKMFNPKSVGYFDPKDKVMPVEVKDSYNIYHNVFSFTVRLRVKATTIDTSLLR